MGRIFGVLLFLFIGCDRPSETYPEDSPFSIWLEPDTLDPETKWLDEYEDFLVRVDPPNQQCLLWSRDKLRTIKCKVHEGTVSLGIYGKATWVVEEPCWRFTLYLLGKHTALLCESDTIPDTGH